MTDSAFCGACGQQIRSAARFCFACGADQGDFFADQEVTNVIEAGPPVTTPMAPRPADGDFATQAFADDPERTPVVARRPNAIRQEPGASEVVPDVAPEPADSDAAATRAEDVERRDGPQPESAREFNVPQFSSSSREEPTVAGARRPTAAGEPRLEPQEPTPAVSYKDPEDAASGGRSAAGLEADEVSAPAHGDQATAEAAGMPSHERPLAAVTSPAASGKSAFCMECGTQFSATGRFCKECGTPRSSEADPAPPSAPPPVPTRSEAAAPVASGNPLAAAHPGPPDWQGALPGPFSKIPLELLVVCVLMALAGALTLWPTLRAVPGFFELLGQDGLSRDLGLLFLTVWVVLALFGCGCLLLAWRLAHADRVARGVSYVLLGGLGGSLLLTEQREPELTLVMLACFAAVAILALSPRVRDVFAGADGDEPTSVVVARTLVAIWAACAVLVGAMFLPIGGLGEEYVVVGVVLLLIGAGAFALNGRLAQGDRAARTTISVGAGIWVILALVLGRRDPGLLIPLAVGVGIVCNLWIPGDAQRHFQLAEQT